MGLVTQIPSQIGIGNLKKKTDYKVISDRNSQENVTILEGAKPFQTKLRRSNLKTWDNDWDRRYKQKSSNTDQNHAETKPDNIYGAAYKISK